jgi:hypothetical protein
MVCGQPELSVMPASWIKDSHAMSDSEIAVRALDFQERAKDYALFEIPGYSDWSKQKLDEGESPAYIANLDARAFTCLPEDLSKIGTDIFEEMLEDLKFSLGE